MDGIANSGFAYLVTTFLWKALHAADLDIAEGTLTCIVGLYMWWLVAGFPETVAWLTDEEKVFVKACLEDGVGDSGLNNSHTFKDMISVFKDCKL